jgi:YrbI family 3-deoxy-D-manno-octulosonate 8-phosphate phosphatase
MKHKIKIFLTDVDGVLTDGSMYLSESGDELKRFYFPDGMGLALIRNLGVKTGIITSETLKLVERRALRLKMDFLKMGATDKLALAKEICAQEKCDLSEVAFVGDDVNDYELLCQVGFAACPQNAQPIIKAIPKIRILSSWGGRGAIREFINDLAGEEALVQAWKSRASEVLHKKS